MPVKVSILPNKAKPKLAAGGKGTGGKAWPAFAKDVFTNSLTISLAVS